jgi:catechol 2,3-dioxygenase-like lactoylglutathione lyase family enzyme
VTTAGEEEAVSFNHIGVCVSDLERSRRFYEDVLEFSYWWELDVPDEAAGPLMQIPPPVGAAAVYLVKGRFVLELIRYAGAGVHAAPRRVMNDLGLTHLSVAVADIGAVLAKVRPAGGDILEDTDMGGRAIMIRDPDGQLIELTTFGFRAMWPPWPDEVVPPG